MYIVVLRRCRVVEKDPLPLAWNRDGLGSSRLNKWGTTRHGSIPRLVWINLKTIWVSRQPKEAFGTLQYSGGACGESQDALSPEQKENLSAGAFPSINPSVVIAKTSSHPRR